MADRDPHISRAALRLATDDAPPLRWSDGGRAGSVGLPGVVPASGPGARRDRALREAGAALRDARGRGSPGAGPMGGGDSDTLASGGAFGSRILDDRARVFLAGVSGALEGGRAAILRPARRHRLNRLARALRIRPFHAALIIAIAQDAARTGASLCDDASTDANTVGSAAHWGVNGARAGADRVARVRVLVLGLALGIVGAVGVAAWFVLI